MGQCRYKLAGALKQAAVKSCSDDDHDRMKTSEEVFRRETIILGVQRLRGEPPLLMGNCPACLSTLGLSLGAEESE